MQCNVQHNHDELLNIKRRPATSSSLKTFRLQLAAKQVRRIFLRSEAHFSLPFLVLVVEYLSLVVEYLSALQHQFSVTLHNTADSKPNKCKITQTRKKQKHPFKASHTSSRISQPSSKISQPSRRISVIQKPRSKPPTPSPQARRREKSSTTKKKRGGKRGAKRKKEKSSSSSAWKSWSEKTARCKLTCSAGMLRAALELLLLSWQPACAR